MSMKAERNPMFWIVTRKQLAELVAADRDLKGLKPPQPAPIVAKLFTKYTKMVQKLDSCYDNTLQWQKSIAMKRLLDSAVSRLSELKEMLVDIDLSEINYIDGTLIEMKLVPREVEILSTAAYPLPRSLELQEMMDKLYRGERIYTEPTGEEVEEEEQKDERPKFNRPIIEKKIDPWLEACKEVLPMIQAHERARQGRLEFFDAKVIRDIRNTYFKPKPIPKELKERCAVAIQRKWRGYVARRDIKVRELERRLLINMNMPSWRTKEPKIRKKEEEERGRKIRAEKLKEYEEARTNEKIRVLRVIGPGLMEDISDEIRWWFKSWHEVATAFDKYPPEEMGGTIIVVRGETMTPKEFMEEQIRIKEEKEKLAANPALAKKMAEEAEKKKKEAEKKAKAEKARLKQERKEAAERAKKGIIEKFEFKDSAALDNYKAMDDIFNIEWTPVDEALNKNNKLIMWKITNEKCAEVQLEMRKIIDEMMRLELRLLNEALDRDRIIYKLEPPEDIPPPPPPEGKKKKKGKKKKDITAHRTTEDLFQELYDNGIIHKYEYRDLDEFVGDYSYKNMELRQGDLDPLASVGDVRRLVINNCILPLGGGMNPRPRSVCICGPRQSGKHLLANAICTATNAIMFDISPENLVGKYPGKKGLKKLVHLVNKMSRILQPSVIYMSGAEKPFYKAVPKPEQYLDPKRLKGQLFKEIVKPLLPEEQVILLGITKQPWMCAPKPFMKCYDKFIMVPRTDYGTMYRFWMDTLMSYHAVDRNFNASALSKLTVGYPISFLRERTQEVLTTRRIIRLKYEPLRVHELLESVIKDSPPQLPVTDEEQALFTNWYNTRIPLGIRKTRVVQAALEERLAAEKAAAKAKK